MAMIALSSMLLAGAAVAVLLDQPSHVAKTLTIFGGVFGVAFGSTLPALRRAYREVELRKMVAADL